MKLKKKSKNKISITIILIIITTITIINNIGTKITNSILDLIEQEMHNKISHYVFNIFELETITNEGMLNLITINKNDKEEILNVDFNLPKSYEYLNISLDNFYKKIDSIQLDNHFFKPYKNIYFIPSGIIYNNILINNLGLNIPCSIKLFNNVNMGLKTKVNNYGINTLLIELYLSIDISSSVLLYSNHNIKENYEILIASKIVYGTIPMYYGGTIEKSSAIVSS